MLMRIVLMYPVQQSGYHMVIDNLLVLLIGGIPIALHTVVSVIMAIGIRRLFEQGAIPKGIMAIEKMAGIDVICSDKNGTLTNKELTVDENLIVVLKEDMTKADFLSMAARASSIENQNAIDSAIGRLSDLKQARSGIQEILFLPFNHTDKRTTLKYTDSQGQIHLVSKGEPGKILDLIEESPEKSVEIAEFILPTINKNANKGARTLAVAYQEVPGPWQILGLLPICDAPRDGIVETIKRARDHSVNVKMITGGELAIAEFTGVLLEMRPSKIHTSASLFSHNKEDEKAVRTMDGFITEADGFAEVSPVHKREIVARLQANNCACGFIGGGLNDVPALNKADIGIAVVNATDAARRASDIVLTEQGLTVTIDAVLSSRRIFQQMKIYAVYAVSLTTHNVLAFMLLALWGYDFPPCMMLIIVILNQGAVMTIPRDKVRPSPLPYFWKQSQIFATGIFLGCYLAAMTAVFFWAASQTDIFQMLFHLSSLRLGTEVDILMGVDNSAKLASALFLHVSCISQAVLFVTRSHKSSFIELPSRLLVSAFSVTQLIATSIAVYGNWSIAATEGIGWYWAGIIWLYNIVIYVLLDIIMFVTRWATIAYARQVKSVASATTPQGLRPVVPRMFGVRTEP